MNFPKPDKISKIILPNGEELNSNNLPEKYRHKSGKGSPKTEDIKLLLTLERYGLETINDLPQCPYCNNKVKVYTRTYLLAPTCGSKECIHKDRSKIATNINIRTGNHFANMTKEQCWMRNHKAELTKIKNGTHHFLKINRKHDEFGRDILAVKTNISSQKSGKFWSLHKNLKLDKDGKSLVHIKVNKSKVKNGTHAWLSKNRNNLRRSGLEINICRYLSHNGIKVKPQFLYNNHRFDIFLPDYNILIECDGYYWHYEKYNQDYNLGMVENDILINDNSIGLRLIRFTDKQYYNNHENLFLDKLIHLIKNNQNIPVDKFYRIIDYKL